MSLHPSKLFALLAAASLAGPAAAQSTPPSSAAPRLGLPPVSARPTGQRLPGKVIWFDLLSLDPARARPFYAGVLGWTFEERGTYSIARDGNVPVAGLIPMPAPRSGAPAPQSRWMPLISVSDVARAAATAQAAGGRVLEGPGSLGRRGRYAAVADPRGAQFVLITAAGGDPVDADAPPPGWMWAELWTDDLMGEAAFYKKVVGYEAWQVGSGKQATWIYASGGRPRARASRMPFEKVPSQWLPYVVVKDLPGALVRVAELGGTVLRKPGTKGPQFAVVADPGGAAFILEQRPEQQDEEVA
ncbi:MAG: VOC family protein, partial [Deltaproteobacteria bacterium]